MESKLIYIADDDKKIRELIKMFLIKEGYEVEVFSDGNEIIDAFNKKTADMLIVDIMMPNVDGLTLCSEIRKKSKVPIIIISAKDTEGDKIAGLVLGSDDYMTKPFSPVELILRVKNIFRRIEPQHTNSAIIKVKDIVIYTEGKYATYNNKDLKLTVMEFNVLLYLAKNLNKTVSREELLRTIWGFKDNVYTRATDDMIKRIRKKLLNVGSSLKIKTLWGVGFIISNKQ